MTRPLWAPWRLEYIVQADEQPGCIFCAEAAGEVPEAESLVVSRGERCFVLLNKYPYASGHLMVAPVRHVDTLGQLDDEEALEVHRLAVASLAALAAAASPHGHNLGWNLGRVAGAGIIDHLHLHVVPRWGGDTNFMPVVGHTRVLPQLLADTRKMLAEAWPTA